MQIASCRVWLNKHSDIAKSRVTPAEVVVLRAIFKQKVGKDPIVDLKVEGTIERSNGLEMRRLMNAYPGKNKEGKRHVTALYPGDSPSLPATFDDIWPLKEESSATEVPKGETPAFNEPVTPLEA